MPPKLKELQEIAEKGEYEKYAEDDKLDDLYADVITEITDLYKDDEEKKAEALQHAQELYSQCNEEVQAILLQKREREEEAARETAAKLEKCKVDQQKLKAEIAREAEMQATDESDTKDLRYAKAKKLWDYTYETTDPRKEGAIINDFEGPDKGDDATTNKTWRTLRGWLLGMRMSSKTKYDEKYNEYDERIKVGKGIEDVLATKEYATAVGIFRNDVWYEERLDYKDLVEKTGAGKYIYIVRETFGTDHGVLSYENETLIAAYLKASTVIPNYLFKKEYKEYIKERLNYLRDKKIGIHPSKLEIKGADWDQFEALMKEIMPPQEFADNLYGARIDLNTIQRDGKKIRKLLNTGAIEFKFDHPSIDQLLDNTKRKDMTVYPETTKILYEVPIRMKHEVFAALHHYVYTHQSKYETLVRSIPYMSEKDKKTMGKIKDSLYPMLNESVDEEDCTIGNMLSTLRGVAPAVKKLMKIQLQAKPVEPIEPEGPKQPVPEPAKPKDEPDVTPVPVVKPQGIKPGDTKKPDAKKTPDAKKPTSVKKKPAKKRKKTVIRRRRKIKRPAVKPLTPGQGETKRRRKKTVIRRRSRRKRPAVKPLTPGKDAPKSKRRKKTVIKRRSRRPRPRVKPLSSVERVDTVSSFKRKYFIYEKRGFPNSFFLRDPDNKLSPRVSIDFKNPDIKKHVGEVVNPYFAMFDPEVLKADRIKEVYGVDEYNRLVFVNMTIASMYYNFNFSFDKKPTLAELKAKYTEKVALFIKAGKDIKKVIGNDYKTRVKKIV